MNILHIAWLGKRNFGDDLMAEAIWEYMNKKEENQWTIWCEERPPSLPRQAHWIYSPVFGATPFFMRKYIEHHALRRADLLLVGGGSVLHSRRSSEWKHQGVSYLHKKGKGNAFGLGLGLGPFDSAEDEAACKAILRELDGLALRDTASYEFAQSCNLPYTPILAFDLAATSSSVRGALKKEEQKLIEHIGMSVRIPYRVDIKETEQRYVELLRALVLTHKKVTLFSFSDDAQKSELNFCKKLVAQIPEKHIEIISYDGNTMVFTNSLASCDFIVTAKLHGAILAYLLKIPFSIISYQRKFEDLANDIGLPAGQRFAQETMNTSQVLKSIHNFSLSGQEESYMRSLKNFDVFLDK